MFNHETLIYGLLLAGIDVLAFPFVKYVSMGLNSVWIIIPVLFYALDPIILLQSLKIEHITIMNLTWNLMSNILITFMGLVMFKEVISTTKWLGVILSFISILFMTYDG